ncbi:dihydrolipoamide acetyltransferase family protein [Isoptericola variabilis]|uniref:Dihydrolipoamide acetyltransferase component of pyruvate dehydrogenase complex n=1 Tax=Isoptericola variabilis (strain 225) TaxID=743718 RepID=F6FUQ3_ISOV2|nr:dihydrolipoamide acetyltransferase family protein [Isoptericola variabilis]AEG43314.1 Dihydrolipoyllysine-residue acetyltransferase [Isoptericola variabilis 225]TWH35250.1 pyruvate dehydrogenase E2 component (dihydrolipoamide acetyltransferase) [Isoptericola variabilis J7]
MTTLREFRLPDLGEGLTESDVVAWRVKAGDRVELNQVIAEVETAKALVEIPSPYAGVVQALHAEEGQTVEVGEPLVTFEVPDDAASSASPAPAPAPPEEVTTPETAEPVSESQGAGAHQPSDTERDEGPEPNLVGYGARPERAGRPRRRPRRYAPVSESGWAGAHQVSDTLDPDARRAAVRAHTTPGIRAMAKRLGVDLTGVQGTGPDGSVTREDVEAAAASGATAHAATHVVSPNGAAPARSETRTPVRGVRKHTAAAMVASVREAPQASVFLTVDVTRSMELLARLKSHRMAGGTRITVLALVARAMCALLPRHPALMTRWQDLPDGGAELVRPAQVDLGIAVATDRGLVVPHVPGADRMSLVELADALGRLTETARAGRTPPERLTGGTLTITNVGVFGVDAGTPILNPGEPAILGVGQVARRPWEHDGEVALRQVMTLSLTFDHRVVDGEQGARFLADLGAVLEDPALALLLGGPDDVGSGTAGEGA